MGMLYFVLCGYERLGKLETCDFIGLIEPHIFFVY